MSKYHQHPPHKRHGWSSVTAFVDIEALGKALAPWVPDAAERDFVPRCVFDEGPARWALRRWHCDDVGQRRRGSARYRG